MQLTALAPTISCEGCAASIKRSLGKLQGVQTVTVDVENKQVQVDWDGSLTNSDAILSRLEAAGFPSSLQA